VNIASRKKLLADLIQMAEPHVQNPGKNILIPFHQPHNPISPATNEHATCHATSIPFPTNPSRLKKFMKRGIGRERNRMAFAWQVNDLRKNTWGNPGPHPFSPSEVDPNKALQT
jgi:hypothetical protein